MVEVRFYWDNLGKMGEKGYIFFGNMKRQRGKMAIKFKKNVLLPFIIQFTFFVANLVKA